MRFICENGLREGDSLPPQEELRRLLRASNNTLSPAMSSLVALGLLSRRTRVGTRVADLHALDHFPWSIGVASFLPSQDGPSAFFSFLHHQIVAALAEANCRVVTYVRRPKHHWPNRTEDFPDLDIDLVDGFLDGLVVLTDLARKEWVAVTSEGIALCHVGPFMGEPCGVVIDALGFAAEAVQALREAQCCRILVDDSVPGNGSALAGQGRSVASIERMTLGQGIESGRTVAAGLLARAPASRPDGIVVTDDYTAAGLAEVFAQATTPPPQIACITNRQLPLSFALPVLRWELDVNALAAQGAEFIRHRLLERVGPAEVKAVTLSRE